MDPRVKPAGDAGEWVSAELGRELIKVEATASSEGPRACDVGKASRRDRCSAEVVGLCQKPTKRQGPRTAVRGSGTIPPCQPSRVSV